MSPSIDTPAPLSALTRARLLCASSATLTTALFKRGLRNVFMQGLSPLNPADARFVAPAYTLRYIPAREDLDGLNAFEDRRHPQRVAVEECPPGHALVMDSRGDPTAASSGNLLVTRLMVRGCAAVVTDGGFRDSPEIAAMPFPAYHQRPSAPTNLIRHHAVDLQQPIACGGVAVYPGDILCGDAEGIVVIPRQLADEIAAEAYRMTQYEDWVQERLLAGDAVIGLYPLLDDDKKSAFAHWLAAPEQSARYPHRG